MMNKVIPFFIGSDYNRQFSPHWAVRHAREIVITTVALLAIGVVVTGILTLLASASHPPVEFGVLSHLGSPAGISLLSLGKIALVSLFVWSVYLKTREKPEEIVEGDKEIFKNIHSFSGSKNNFKIELNYEDFVGELKKYCGKEQFEKEIGRIIYYINGEQKTTEITDLVEQQSDSEAIYGMLCQRVVSTFKDEVLKALSSQKDIYHPLSCGYPMQNGKEIEDKYAGAFFITETENKIVSIKVKCVLELGNSHKSLKRDAATRAFVIVKGIIDLINQKVTMQFTPPKKAFHQKTVRQKAAFIFNQPLSESTKSKEQE